MEKRSVKHWTLWVVLALAGCGGRTEETEGANSPPVRERERGGNRTRESLYFRLGGERAIARLVDDFMPRAASDPQINFVRERTPREWQPTPEAVAHLKKMLVEYLSSVAGGPVRYEGKDLKTAHAGMAITNAEFDAFVADLRASLVKCGVGAREQDELLALIASSRGDIVE